MSVNKISWVWQYFCKEESSNTKGGVRARCQLCPNKSFSYHGSTSSLQFHLKEFHHKCPPNQPDPQNSRKRDSSGRLVPSDKQGPSSTLISEPSRSSLSGNLITDYFTTRGNRPCDSNRCAAITKIACRAVVADILPLSCFEREGLRSLLEFVEPNYQPPTHKTVTAHIDSLYTTALDQMKAELSSIDPFAISITCDYWTNSQMLSFLTVTAHYIVESEAGDWILKQSILSTVEADYSHTANNIATELESVLDDFLLKNKVWYAYHDNATNMKLGMDLCTAVECHVGCFAHLLQLAVNDSLAIAEECISQVHTLVSKFKTSTSMRNLFNQERSSLVSQGQSNVACRELQLNNVTRWSSTFNMLKSYVDLETVLNICGELNDDFKRLLPPRSSQATIRQLIQLLEPVAKITLM